MNIIKKDTEKSQVRALGLLSGGLDSILAVKILQEQGIEVTGLSFITPFFGPKNAQAAATMLSIPLLIVDISYKLFEIVKNPPHGHGKAINPCIDCHTLMIQEAGKIMEEKGFDFVFTGEVLGERPMSQWIHQEIYRKRHNDPLHRVPQCSAHLPAKFAPPCVNYHLDLQLLMNGCLPSL